MNFVIENVAILTPLKILPTAYMLVVEGRIAQISEQPIRHKNVICGKGKLLIPGMVNAHTHASMSLFRGLGEGRRDRLTKFMFPLEKKTVSPELVFLSALQGLAEMICHGVTAFCDMYYFEDQVGKAAETLGMRGVIGETIVNFIAPDSTKSYEGLDIAHRCAETWKNNELISFAYAPHAPYTVEPHILREINSYADQNNAFVTMHVAEFEDEWDRVKAIADIKEGESIVAYLERQNTLRQGSLFAHTVHVDHHDIAIMAKNGIHVAHCPVANAKSGKGIAPIVDMKSQGITIGLATDGSMSGNRLGLRDALSYTYSMAKLRSHDPTHLSPADVFHMATKGGYQSIHIEDAGTLVEGAKADFTMINLDDIGMIPDYEIITNLILSVSDRAFEATWINGIKVAENGIPTLPDWDIYQKEIFNLKKNLTKFIKTL